MSRFLYLFKNHDIEELFQLAYLHVFEPCLVPHQFCELVDIRDPAHCLPHKQLPTLLQYSARLLNEVNIVSPH